MWDDYVYETLGTGIIYCQMSPPFPKIKLALYISNSVATLKSQPKGVFQCYILMPNLTWQLFSEKESRHRLNVNNNFMLFMF